MVNNLPAMQETWVQFWAWEDPWRRKWQPTPVFLPGEFNGQRSLGGYSPWGHPELDMTEQLIHTYTHRHHREITEMVRYGWKKNCKDLLIARKFGGQNLWVKDRLDSRVMAVIGRVCPTCLIGYLAMSADIFDCYNVGWGCFWHLVGRSHICH